MGLVIALAIPTSHYWLLGLLQNEAFYGGMPTSYWVSALEKRGYFGFGEPPRDVEKTLLNAGTAAVPVLADMLQVEDDDVRQHALLVLFAMKPGEAAAAVPGLERSLMNEEADFHFMLASGVLAKAAPDQEQVLRVFMAVLERGRTAKSRAWAAAALGNLGQKARPAIGALCVALDDEDLDVRVRAARTLWQLERRDGIKLLLILAQAGERDFSGVGSRLTSPLAVWDKIGPEAQDAVPGLLQALQNPDERIRLRATIALGHLAQDIRAEEAVRALAARLKDDWIAVRRGAASALRQIGPQAREAVPDLVRALKDDDASLRAGAAAALGLIGPPAKAAVPDLGLALKDADATVRRTAANALGSIGPTAKAAVLELIEALKDKDEYTRDNAAQALGRIGPAASAAIPGLMAALQDESRFARRDAAHALAQIALAQVQVP
jgi:HEAT repeat protein